MKKLLLIAAVLLCACGKDNKNGPPGGKPVSNEYRIAVVLPTGGAVGAYWKKSIDWSLENLNKALVTQRGIRVTAEWFDEERPEQELKKLFGDLAAREDICAVLGPLYSAHAKIAADACSRSRKMLIPATVSSESVMRQYAGKDFLWCLAENDISQCEILLTRAKQKGAESVSLLTSDDAYGQTFFDWFAYQAQKLGLKVGFIEQYTAANVTEKMEAILRGSDGKDCLICVPNTQQIAREMNICRRNRTEGSSFLLFSDVAYITPKDATFEGMEGITQLYDPESGFAAAYEARYGHAPSYGSAHFYDAVTLAGLALLHANLTEETDLNASMKQLVDGDDGEVNTCSETGVARAVGLLIAGKRPHCTGASGQLRFDRSDYTNVLHSVYCHWQVYEGKHRILEYNTSDASRRSDASTANWNWKTAQEQKFENYYDKAYISREGVNALIIDASSGWSNYRHQANAYAVYQMLKKNGIDDNHILLISEDDIADNPQNPQPGFIQSSRGDENLREGVKVDYHLSELKFDMLKDAFTNSPDFQPAEHNDLFVYWVGDGDPAGPKWGEQVLSAADVVEFFKGLIYGYHARRIFVVVDTSFGGVLGKAFEDLRTLNLVCYTATNEHETSKASRTDATGQVWISSSFTDNLLEEFLSRGADLSFDRLYKNIYYKTIGSHVVVYNIEQFGILNHAYVKDFIYP